jgi:hypothetical protein
MTNDKLQRGKAIDMKRPRKGEWVRRLPERRHEWDPGAGGAKTRLRKAYVAANSTARYDTEQGRAKAKRRRVSARGNGYHFAGWIAPNLSHACGLHRPGYDRSPASPNPARWYFHGAAQNRRGTVLAVSHIFGAPSFSPHRSRVSFALSPIRPLAVSPS